ncbi:MAG: hypothetical protein IJT28_02750 [Bacteroidaceae bacterium]|nr:hypothetical protein [Bacteroidaceae bacterium]
MKSIFNIVVMVLLSTPSFAQDCKNLRTMNEAERTQILCKKAQEVMSSLAPEWMQWNVIPKVSPIHKYFSNNQRPDIQRNLGREYYIVTFYYDEATKAKIKYDYAGEVRIWADNGEVESIGTGEGWYRVFHNTSYEQMKKEGIKATDQMHFVPIVLAKE